MWLRASFFFTFFSLFLPFGAAGATTETLLCRGREILLRADPSAVAVQTFDGKTLSATEVLPAGVEELLYEDSSSGRFAFRLRSKEEAEVYRSMKSSSLRFFPVFVSETGGVPVWAFDEITVRVEGKRNEESLKRFCEENGLEIRDKTHFIQTIYLLAPKAPSGKTAFDWAKTLAKEDFVRWSEPNLYGGMSLQFTPNDPYFPNQFHHTLLQSTQAWDVTRGSSSIVVAFLDEGIDKDHVDLADNLWVNPVEAAGLSGVDDDGNGYVDDINGWDFTSSPGDPDFTPSTTEIGAHGTAVSGLVAAVQNNATGVSGVAPLVRLLSCRHWNGASYTGDFNTTRALEYAAMYADVINMSWGGQTPQSNSIFDAIDFAVRYGRGGKGCVVVAATGNDGENVFYPARYPWTVAAGESENNDFRHPESAFDGTVSLMAPSGIWTTDNTGSGNGFDDIPGEPNYTADFYGTSGAAPQVSAVIAMILSRFPDLTGTEAVLSALNSADNPPSSIVPYDEYGKSPTVGYGRINLRRAVLFGEDSVDDRLEPNDIPEDAARLTAGFYPWLYLGDNADFYELEGVQGSPIIVQVEYLSDFGGLTFALLDENLQILGTPDPVEGTLAETLKIRYVPTRTGKLYLQIGGTLGQPYTLLVRVGRADDSYEPNQFTGQAGILFPTSSGDSYTNLVLNNDDYYQVELLENEYLYGLVTFNHNRGNLGVDVLHPNGGLIESSNRETYGEQFLPFQATEEGEYTIRVFGSNGDINREYALHLAILPTAPLTSGDDLYAGNQTIASAQLITPGFYPNLYLTEQANGKALDYFKFSVPAGNRVRLTIGWSVPGVDLDLYLYGEEIFTAPDPNAVDPLSRSVRFSVNVESVTLPPISHDETFLAVVARAGGSDTAYRLALEYLEPEVPSMVAFWRLNEGSIGASCDPFAIRDWRGPTFSTGPQGSAGLKWVAGPSGLLFPGSDGIALDCTEGGIYFPDNGDQQELERPSEKPFTFWARINPLDNASLRTVASLSSVWEFGIDSSNQLTFTARSGSSNQVYTGPEITPGEWQDVAVVWDPDTSGGQVRLLTTTEGQLVQTTLAMGLSFSGTGTFSLGSFNTGSAPVGLVEQARYFGEALSYSEVQAISVSLRQSGHDHWTLYR